MKNKNILLILLSVNLILVDQLIKFVVCKYLYNSQAIAIKGFLNITYVENTGGAYGIASNNVAIFAIITAILIALLIGYLMIRRRNINACEKTSIISIISGGIGNLIDRVFRGFVVDYIDVNPIIKFPMFNFADILIVLGCITLIINLILRKENGV